MLNHVLRESPRRAELLEVLATPRERKTPEQIGALLAEMERCGSIAHGWKVARAHADLAAQLLARLDFLAPRTPLAADEAWPCEVVDARFLRELVNYVIYRNL